MIWKCLCICIQNQAEFHLKKLINSRRAQNKNVYEGKKIREYDLKKKICLKYIACYKVICIVASTNNTLTVEESAFPQCI